MTTFSINTLGCKVNQYETQQIRELLEQLGLSQVEATAQPDVIVINTCCVTHSASSKSRQAIRRAGKLNPNATIVATGCLCTADTDEADAIGDNIHLIGHQQDLLNCLIEITGKKNPLSDSANGSSGESSVDNKPENPPKVKHKNELVGQTNLGPLKSFTGQTRAFLKAQDGCDGFCSYCIVPKIRKNVHFKPTEIILQEAQSLVEAGHKEIVLTGIFLGAYGKTTVKRKKWQGESELAELLTEIAQVPGLERVRLSSVEPGDVTESLLRVFERFDNVVPHLHLPLQSGSERILKKMCRQYTVEEYRNIIEKLKLRLDRPAITTDIIVGFPGETEEDFAQSVGIARDMGFAKIHVFSFSKRAGTAAAVMQDQVDTRVIKKRSKVLRELDQELSRKFRDQFIGEKVRVIAEQSEPWRGRCDRYFEVEVESDKNIDIGQVVYCQVGKI